MLYYKGSQAPNVARYADTKGASSDVEGLVSMSVDPPWVPG